MNESDKKYYARVGISALGGAVATYTGGVFGLKNLDKNSDIVDFNGMDLFVDALPFVIPGLLVGALCGMVWGIERYKTTGQ